MLHNEKRRKGKRSVNKVDHVYNLFSLFESNPQNVVFTSQTDEQNSSTENRAVVVNSISQFYATVNVEGIEIKTLIDTGSSLNILNQKTFEKINHKLKGKLTLKKTSTKVITYGSNEPTLKIKGVVSLLIENNHKYVTKDFHVIKTKHKNLLNGESAVDLDLIKISRSQKQATCSIAQCDNINQKETTEKENTSKTRPPTRLQPLINYYKEKIFSGKIGKFKDFQIKLHIDEKVPTVAQAERRIPFALRKKVQAEVEKLEKLEIIEDVTGQPTPWLNPIVAVPKGNGSIRLCLDMRSANKAITRTRYPTPTVDDLLIKLRGSQHFTKLDLNAAFHQLELDPESRYITAFRTENKIKQYKRLIFGVNSAAEELQHALQTTLSDINGVVNIADDILIFAKTVKEHDQILTTVFKRLSEKGLTLNLDKSIFDKASIEYFGFIFSENGMKPSLSKIDALKQAEKPKDVKSIRSFQGMTNYLKRFIPEYSTKLKSSLKEHTTVRQLSGNLCLHLKQS